MVLTGKQKVTRRLERLEKSIPLNMDLGSSVLFDRLKALRLRLASEQHASSYMVFSDKLLQDMAKIQLQNNQELSWSN